MGEKFECPLGKKSKLCNWKNAPGMIRDQADVGIIECSNCEMKKHQMDLRYKVDYESGSMHEWTVGYGNELVGPSLDLVRRINLIKKLVKSEKQLSILDFGCGNGEMLEALNTEFANVSGLEPEIGARTRSINKGFDVAGSISELVEEKSTFNVITLFHVIEHIYEPIKILNDIKSLLRKDGYLIIETPNSQDALISLYENNEFRNFTYWSHHPFLYSNKSLEMIVKTVGLEIIINSGVQRYSIDNHLYWLSKGLPGGHEVWKNKFGEKLKKAYDINLVESKIQDTLWLVARNSKI